MFERRKNRFKWWMRNGFGRVPLRMVWEIYLCWVPTGDIKGRYSSKKRRWFGSWEIIVVAVSILVHDLIPGTRNSFSLQGQWKWRCQKWWVPMSNTLRRTTCSISSSTHFVVCSLMSVTIQLRPDQPSRPAFPIEHESSFKKKSFRIYRLDWVVADRCSLKPFLWWEALEKLSCCIEIKHHLSSPLRFLQGNLQVCISEQ